MKRIQLRRMHIENFKGIPLFDIDFDESVTNIVGRNGAGKTTLHDAYLWAITGEDSNECSSFKVQPIGKDGVTLKKVSTTVEVCVAVNGDEHTFRRTLDQSWSQPRGGGDEVQGANVSAYFVDGIPKKYTEYRDFVKVLFCEIQNFRLVSSITAFCNLDTKTRRKKLLEMAGEMPELINEESFPFLYDRYKESKDIEGIKAKTLFERKNLVAEQASIPDKMTENERNLPAGIDFDALKKRRDEIELELKKIDDKLTKAAATRDGIIAKIDAVGKAVFDLEVELTEIDGQLESQIKRRKDELSRKLMDKKVEESKNEILMSTLVKRKESVNGRVSELEDKRKALFAEWTAKNDETFDSAVSDSCPTCGRKFTEEEMLTMRDGLVRAFNTGKTAVLRRIVDDGNAVKDSIVKAKEELADTEAQITLCKGNGVKLHDEIAKLQNELDAVPTIEYMRERSLEYQNVRKKIDSARAGVRETAPATTEEENELRKRKESLQLELKEVNLNLGQEVMIAKVEARRLELKQQDYELGQSIADLDAVLFEIREYEKAMIDAVESRVSSMFKFVKWKMYEKNLTNDGEKEICECIVDGVPYSTNLNTAKIVNAGIDIVNAISKWLGICVPIWIDGKESVTNLIDTDAQLITLSVVDGAELSVV